MGPRYGAIEKATHGKSGSGGMVDHRTAQTVTLAGSSGLSQKGFRGGGEGGFSADFLPPLQGDDVGKIKRQIKVNKDILANTQVVEAVADWLPL